MDTGFDAIIQKLRQVLKSAWRQWKLAAAVAWVVALAAAVIIPLVPQRFESNARIYVDTQSVLKPLMEGLAYQPDIDQQVRMLARTVISRPNLERLVEQSGIWSAGEVSGDREKILARLMRDIKFAPVTTDNLYAISYRDTGQERAQRIVESIVDLFVHASSKDKKRDSEDATRFIVDQIKAHEIKLVEAENRLKDFKVKNFGVSGISNQDYFTRMSTMADELNKLRADLRAAERSRDAYRRELAAEDPQLPVVTEIDTGLAVRKKQLEELLRRFTDQHPDVVSARQVIAELEQERSAAASARPNGARTTNKAATSPVYQRIRVSLAESEAEVESLRSRVAAEQQRLDEIRSVAGRVPQVEAELAQLNRDYDIIRKNYDQLVSRRESASLGVKLDESAHLTDFRVIEPPRVSPSPVFPSHVALAMIAVLVSLAAGFLAPTALSLLRPTFDDANSLRALTGRPVLGSISQSLGAAAVQARRSDIVRFGMAIALLVLFQAAWLAWIVNRSPPFGA